MDDTLAKLRSGLCSSAVPDAGKVDLLRELVALGGPGATEVLRAALAAEANARVLPFLVRACGSLRDRRLLADVERFVGSPDELLAQNALKAAAAIDAGAAVRLAAPLIRSARAELAWGFARILARRCPAEARALFLELARSPEAKDRVTALVYLRDLPPEESAPVVVQMLRGEPEPDLAALLLRLLSKKLCRATAAPLEQYAKEVETRRAAVQEVLAALPERTEPELPAAVEADELKDALATGKSEFLDDAPLATRFLVSPRQEPVRPSRPSPKPPAATPSPGWHRGVLAGAVASSLLVVAALARGPRAEVREAAPAASTAATVPRPGSKVRLACRVVEVRGDLRSMRVEDEEKRGAWVQFLTLDVTQFAPGSAVVVEGILKERRADGTAVVHGFTAVRP